MKFPAKCLLLLLLPVSLSAEEVAAPERFSEGQVWFSVEIEARSFNNGDHGGWDFFDGEAKQFWVGSGWKSGDRGKWGLWSPNGGVAEFKSPVNPGETVRFAGKIDFGAKSVTLWSGNVEIARISGVSLSGVDRARTFVARGGDYRLEPPRFARSRAALDGERLFVEKIRPLFREKCLSCHGDDPDKIKGGFDMRTRAGLLAGGESGEAGLAPGEPERSPIYVAVTWTDENLEMPPKANDRLSAEQVADLKTWIAAGAPWVETQTNLEKPGIAEKAGVWSKPDADGRVRISTSGGLNEDWTNRTYDSADVWAFRPRTRVSPPKSPTAHPVDSFVDARLAEAGIEPAPRAGDRDLRRRLSYSLTGLPPNPEDADVSYEALLDRLLDSPHFGERMAQHWLDVVRYADSNGFSRDELRPDAHRYRTYAIESFNADKPYDRFVREQIAGDELGIAGQEALGFLWMGPWEMTNMTSAAVARQMWLDDVVNSIGITFLGQELRCAKCHDHKFDPIPTRDFYAMQAVFGATKHHVKAGRFEVQPRQAETVSILKGGSLESPLEPVAPGFLSAVRMAGKFPVSAENRRRAALANWIAAEENPLTARVMVNRVWAWHFGRGLVATPNGFGVVGSKPSHPELLDWLANWFVENGWSVKKLTRLLLTSEAYQRSSAKPSEAHERDPDNRLLAAFRPRRLTAEEIRDSMLAASGELNSRVGGPSFRAEINWEVAFQPRLTMGKIAPPWQPDSSRAERNRRSIYAMRVRNLGHPLMEVLNRPLSELSCEMRDETTVVTQAFSLFHGQFANARALALANRAMTEAANLEAGIFQVFAHVFGRSPSKAEAERSLAHVSKMLEHHRANSPERTELPTEVTLSNVIEETGEPAYSTFKLDKLANYERDLQPWDANAETRALAELCLVLLNSSEFLHVY